MYVGHLSHLRCFERHVHFNSGRTSLEDDKRSGRPPTSLTPETVQQLVHDDRRNTIYMISLLHFYLSPADFALIPKMKIQLAVLAPLRRPGTNLQKVLNTLRQGDFQDTSQRNTGSAILLCKGAILMGGSRNPSPRGERMPSHVSCLLAALMDEHTSGEEREMKESTGLIVERPQSATAIKGKNITFVAKVDSSKLLRKPVFKWLKGKWLDLGSKAGKHLQFKETYDRNNKIYTYEMTIVKVVEADAGSYRCEVTGKDKCDSWAFDITVEAAQEAQQTNILEAFKRSGEAGEDAGDLDFSGLLKKRERKQKEEPQEEVDVWEILKKAKPSFLKKLDPAYSVEKGKKIQLCVELADPNQQVKYIFESIGGIRKLTINKCTLSDDAAYECVVDEEKCFTEVFVQVEFEVEVSEEGANVKWMKDGVELSRDGKYRIKKEGTKHWLIINEATKDDIGMYHVYTSGGESKGELEVEDKELEVLQSIADLTLRAAEQAVFKCEVSDEKVTGKWFKNGEEVVLSDRIKVSHIGRIHKLTIDDVKPEDAGDYTFVPDGYAISLSAKLNFIEPPKIHLDTTGNMVNKNTIIVVAGNKLRLDVEITGEPAPTVCWKKGDTNLNSFVIEGAERSDEGPYSITVTNPVGEDKAEVTIRIVDVPDPPENVHCTGVGEDSASVLWDPPKFDGYLMERRKKGSSRWTKLNFDIHESTVYEVKKMIEGVMYEMRVFAVNSIGISQPSEVSKPFMPIAPTSEPTRLMVDDITDNTCALRWLPPERIGAGGVDGYIIEYCLEGGNEWVQANETPVDKTSYRIRDLKVGDKYLFRVKAVNIAGLSPPAEINQGVTIQEITENPRIRLPRQLRTKFIKKVGEKVNIVIPFQGKPHPVVRWFKDDDLLDLKLVNIRTTEVDTILFIRSATREHSGKYTLSVQVENMEDRATVEIQVVEKPGFPVAVTVTDVWGFNAALEWKPPKDNGNTEITGYTIQKADMKTKEWFTVYEHNRRPSCTVSDLVMGNEYTFRVFSENICGLSEEAGLSKNTAVIPKAGLQYKAKPFKELDMNSSPKFITPLVDRCVIAGYSAAISCAVRGSPKPKIIWMKNKMIIGGDPKFIMQNNQGVLTLNIRKPGLFDGGMYTCRAVNDLGEDQVECKLEVRVVMEKGVEKK
ncbi:myosin-binding protein C, fast-type [Silurus meridionalis]|nr:myosin-binding protein C, fast-type [Silurus meridionalis]